MAVAVLQRVEAAAPEPARAPPWKPLAALGGLGAIVAAALVGAEAETIARYAQEHTTMVAGALITAALALALALVATVSVATTRGGRPAR